MSGLASIEQILFRVRIGSRLQHFLHFHLHNGPRLPIKKPHL